jgi:diguanylate cyclase (GGDEF)-like protein/PAS domain S-box-containing protein
MDARVWTRAEIQDFARGQQIRLHSVMGEDLPLPGWLAEVIGGISRFGPRDDMNIAHPDDHAAMIELFVDHMSAFGTAASPRFRYDIDGTWRWVTINGLNLLHQEDVGAVLVCYVVGEVVDMGDAERAPARLGDHDAISWMQVELDGLGTVLHVEGKSLEIVGRTPAEMIGARLISYIHPDSSADTIPMWFSLLDEGPGATRSSRRCYVHPDGTEVWVEAAFLNRLDADAAGGGSVLMVAFDITERRVQEQALRERTDEVARLAEESRLLAEEVPAAVFRCDDQGTVRFYNARWRELLGRDSGVTRLHETVHHEDRKALTERLAEVVADLTSTARSFELRSVDGRIFAFRCRSVADADPARRRIIGSIEDVTATVRLRVEARHDALTGLLNRAAIDLALAAAIRDDTGDVLVLFLDLDGFKEVNDVYGHNAGDVVLKEVASRLSSAFRPEDLVGRYGGDEFVVVCHSVEGSRSDALVERLRVALAGDIPFTGGSWPVAASIGAGRPGPGDDVTSLLRRADEAMFSEKRQRQDARR